MQLQCNMERNCYTQDVDKIKLNDLSPMFQRREEEENYAFVGFFKKRTMYVLKWYALFEYLCDTHQEIPPPCT